MNFVEQCSLVRSAYPNLYRVCIQSTLFNSFDPCGQTRFLTALYEATVCQRKLRIGIMGGTFDPIHYGHLVTGDQALFQYHLDFIVYLVASQPALKQDKHVSDVTCRLAMTQMALKDHENMYASSFELMRPGITYTIDTLEALSQEGRRFGQAWAQDLVQAHGMVEKSKEPDQTTLFDEGKSAQTNTVSPHNSLFDLTFITGLDAVCTIMHWERPCEIFQYARIVAATRPGHTADQARAALRRANCSGEVELMAIPSLSISSSEIRSWIRQGKSVRYLTPDCVLKYALDNRVYTSEQPSIKRSYDDPDGQTN